MTADTMFLRQAFESWALHASPDERTNWEVFQAGANAAAQCAAEGDDKPVAWGLFAKVEDGSWHLQHPVRFTEADAKADRTMYERTTAIDIRPLYDHPQPKGTAVGEIVEMDDGALVPVWADGTPAAGCKLYTAPAPAPAPEAQRDGWNEPYNCIAAGPTATDVALWQAMNEAAKHGNRDDDKLIRKALNDAGYYLVRSMKKPGTCEHLLAAPCAAVVDGKPAAWIEHDWSGTGARRLHFERRPETVRDEVVNPVWTPLYAHPPVQNKGEQP